MIPALFKSIDNTNLELIVFSEDDHATHLTSYERKRWLIALLTSPCSSDTAVPDDDAILQPRIEMKDDVTARLLMSQVYSEPAAAAATVISNDD